MKNKKDKKNGFWDTEPELMDNPPLDWYTEPPYAQRGTFSKKVIVITNKGNSYVLAYFVDKDGKGVWERNNMFSSDEVVIQWCPHPFNTRYDYRKK